MDDTEDRGHGGLLVERMLEFARELGPATERLLGEESVRCAVTARVSSGLRVEDAVLVEVHRAAGADRRVADEFLAHLLPELAKAGHRVRSSGLRRFLDTGDLVQSVLGDLWPEIQKARFQSRRSFVAFLARRLSWKARDKARALEAGLRREDLRVEVDPEEDPPLESEDPFLASVRREESERLIRLLLHLSARDRTLLTQFLRGVSLDVIARECELSKDAARMAIQRAIQRLRVLR